MPDGEGDSVKEGGVEQDVNLSVCYRGSVALVLRAEAAAAAVRPPQTPARPRPRYSSVRRAHHVEQIRFPY